MLSKINERIDGVFVVVDELKSEIKTQQELSRKQEKKLATIDTLVSCINDTMQQCVTRRGEDFDDEFTFEKISSAQELATVEENLANDDFFKKVLNFLRSSVHRVDVNNRLHDALDIIFDRNFLPQCAWKGVPRLGVQKIAMVAHPNILRLFKAVGTTDLCKCTDVKVGDFFQNKLKHAKNRTNLQGFRKTSCQNRRKLP
uniref:DUF4806 domain-containing protein n=3 Tax=gambiae species complex TaxID=44542 RepID=A0A0E3W2D1_ANOGA